MNYYEALGMNREPFSTSPDPEFFYPSTSHETALRRLEDTIRQQRGLSVIFGDVGTGKTTLLRALLQTFKDDKNAIVHMILDPGYESEFQFLSTLVNFFGITPSFRSTLDFKEGLQQYLFQKAVEEKKIIVLLIDEAQKISLKNLEVLRMLLNFETNEHKLLQLVIMGQMEFLERTRRIKNFSDRIALKYSINPLDAKETSGMIDYRLRKAGCDQGVSLFTDDALKLVYLHTGGYPRRIAMLCHDALQMMVTKGVGRVDPEIIRGLVFQEIQI